MDMFPNQEDFQGLGHDTEALGSAAELRRTCTAQTTTLCGAGRQMQGTSAHAKPPNAARSHLDQEEFSSEQGSVPCPVLPEQAGTTQIAYLIHSLDKPSRMIKILQYVTLKSKVSWTH